MFCLLGLVSATLLNSPKLPHFRAGVFIICILQLRRDWGPGVPLNPVLLTQNRGTPVPHKPGFQNVMKLVDLDPTKHLRDLGEMQTRLSPEPPPWGIHTER